MIYHFGSTHFDVCETLFRLVCIEKTNCRNIHIDSFVTFGVRVRVFSVQCSGFQFLSLNAVCEET